MLVLAVASLLAVGLRLVFMQRIQRRRERDNRQINERLKTLIAAYKTLGGSFTGDLAVDPSHLRDFRQAAGAAVESPLQTVAVAMASEAAATAGSARIETPGSDRRRRVRDAVEAALSDVILLGTEEQVRLAVQAANDMVAGRSVHTAELVASLRGFIREVLELDALPAELAIPNQGPSRTGGGPAARGGGARNDATRTRAAND